MEVVGGALGDDLHLSAAGLAILRGVGILVDADTLDCRRRNADGLAFDAIDHRRCATFARYTGVEKCGKRGHDVGIEDGKTLHVAGGNRGRVRHCFRAWWWKAFVGVDGDAGDDAGEVHDEGQGEGVRVIWTVRASG